MPIKDGKEVGLRKYSDEYKKRETARNKYNNNDEYRQGHADAVSDGDEAGKGENNGSVGSKTDVERRRIETARNRYSKNNPYDSSKI